MFTGAIQTSIQKRRVIYCSDRWWDYVIRKAKSENKSVSAVIREILKEKIK